MSPDSGLRAVEAAFGVEAFPFPDRETDKANAVTKLPNPNQCLTQPEIRFRCDGGAGGEWGRGKKSGGRLSDLSGQGPLDPVPTAEVYPPKTPETPKYIELC